jgi:putative ABC transport system substrate-binding protein
MKLMRRELIALACGASAWPFAAGAQQASVPIVGFVSGRSLSSDQHLVVAFRDGLQDIGYIDGRNVRIRYRWADGRSDRLLVLVDELIRENVAVLFAGAVDIQIKNIYSTISSIPIVFATGGDLIELGIAASLNRPGGNATGVTVLAAELWPKQLQLLREMVGRVNLIALLVNPSNVTAASSTRAVLAAADRIGQEILVANARSAVEFDSAFETIAKHRAGGMLVAIDALFINQREKLVALAAKHRIPAIYGRREFAVAGGLVSYGASTLEQYRQSGAHVGRILKGTKPAELPVLQPTKFEFVINAKAAEALGLSVPPTLLAGATELIE